MAERRAGARCCAGSPSAVGRALREDRGAHAALRRGRLDRRAPAGTARRTSRCRSPRTSASRSRSRSWSRARTSRRCSSSRRTCAPTRRRTASTPRTCSATSARSPRTSSTRPRPTSDTSVHGASVVGRAGLEKAVRRVPARLARLQAGRGRLDGSGARRLRRDPGPAPATPWSPRSTPGCRPSSSSSSSRPSRPPARPSTRSPARNYVADSGAAVVMDANTGRIVAMASQPTYDPERLGRRHHLQAARAGSTPRRPAPRCCPAPPRASSPRARRGSRS